MSLIFVMPDLIRHPPLRRFQEVEEDGSRIKSGMTIRLDEGFRADLLVEGKLLIELKSVERTAPVHGKQVLTYKRLMDLPLGLLMNFGAATFREGTKRVANNRSSLRLGGPSAPPAASLRTGFA
jgi:hypothetical protein